MFGARAGSNAQGFQYDGVGRLVAVRRGTAWNGAQVGTWSATWGQGVDNLVSLKPAPDVAEVMAVKDGRGSVVGYYRGETPTQGLWVTADYTPEGRATQRDWVAGTSCTESGTTQCPRMGGLPFGFHGAYKSPAHGLLYFRNRWYSVEAGQWLTHDPLGEVDSVNLYAFNRFDSVNFVDPFGLKSDGAAPEAKCGNGRTTCKWDVGPWLKREVDEQNRIQERDSVAARQASAQAMATAVVGIIGAASGGIGTAGAARLPKHPLVVVPVVGIGVGVQTGDIGNTADRRHG